MSLYLKLFETTAQYNAYTADTSNFIKPNVSLCVDDPSKVYYNPLRCDETSEYEVIGQPTYPSTVDGDATSFEMTVNYKRTDINAVCQETVTEGTDTVTVEISVNPSTSSTRTVSGTVDYHGNEIEYSVTQSKFEVKVTTKYNVTDTSNPTRIASATTSFTKVVIDGVGQPSIRTGYTFSTTGEHTVKYYLKGTSIGQYAFSDCNSLTSIDIPDSVTSIGQYAFWNCTSLTSIDIPDNVTSIGYSAFYNCSGLTSCTIGNGVTSIGDSVFDRCSGLTSVTIGDSVRSISNSAFSYCYNITSIDIPDSVTSIGDRAFRACTAMTSCTIGSGVTSIGTYAFRNCTSLTSVTINATTPPTLGSNTFANTTCRIYVPSGSVDTYKAANGWSTYKSRIQAIP